MAFLSELVSNNLNYILIFAAIILLLVGIILIRKFMQKKQKNRELRQAAEDKQRDENLNNVILNNHVGSNRPREVHVPYDVDYSNPGGESSKNPSLKNKRKDNHVMLQLVEKTELSTRKFMLNPIKKIRIGSDLQDNDISVLSDGVSPHQCEIFSVGDKIYIKNRSNENQTIVKRKKEQAIVDEKGLRLLSNDKIILGSVVYEVTIKD